MFYYCLCKSIRDLSRFFCCPEKLFHVSFLLFLLPFSSDFCFMNLQQKLFILQLFNKAKKNNFFFNFSCSREKKYRKKFQSTFHLATTKIIIFTTKAKMPRMDGRREKRMKLFPNSVKRVKKILLKLFSRRE